MCGGMVDIQSVTAEIRREKQKKEPGQKIMSASATHGGHKQPLVLSWKLWWDYFILFWLERCKNTLRYPSDPLTLGCGPADGVVS